MELNSVDYTSLVIHLDVGAWEVRVIPDQHPLDNTDYSWQLQNPLELEALTPYIESYCVTIPILGNRYLFRSMTPVDALQWIDVICEPLAVLV